MKLFFGLLVAVFSVVQCDDFETLMSDGSATDADCVEFVSAGGIYVYKSPHIPLVMRKGLWTCVKEIITLAQRSGSDVRNIFDMESRTLMKEIATLKATVESSLPIASITPAFQWAQSPNEIFINVKFAHKLDAPATLNVETKNVTVSGSVLYLQASDGRKNFVLDLDLLRDVNVEQSTWSMASVGRMVFTLKKDESPSKWTRLLKSKRKPQNMHSWWELSEKHREELDKLDESDSDEDPDEVSSKRSPKKPAVPSTNDTQAAAATAAAVPEDDSIGSGSIETPGQTAKKIAKENIENDLKVKIKALEDDIRARKKEIDGKAKAEKKLLDAELKEKKDDLSKESAQALLDLNSSKSEL